jgi:hypothetical protein
LNIVTRGFIEVEQFLPGQLDSHNYDLHSDQFAGWLLQAKQNGIK